MNHGVGFENKRAPYPNSGVNEMVATKIKWIRVWLKIPGTDAAKKKKGETPARRHAVGWE